MPGSMMLSVQRVRPVISRASSLRRRALPTLWSLPRRGVGGGHAAPPALAAAAKDGAPAACWIALTMF